jgi:flagellar biosynthesis/type III secretory pathway protein FliH
MSKAVSTVSPKGALRFTSHGQIGTSGERKRKRKESLLPTYHRRILKTAPANSTETHKNLVEIYELGGEIMIRFTSKLERAVAEATEEALKKGVEEGIKQGREEALKEGRVEIYRAWADWNKRYRAWTDWNKHERKL